MSRCAAVALVALAVLLTGSPARATGGSPGDAGALAARTVTFEGRGYGHGHGLSQYGAEGAARQGLTYRQILRFYYPGLRWGRTSGKVKVLITRDTTADVVVADRSGLTVRSLGTGRTWPLTHDARLWRITPAAGDRSTVSYRASGSWTRLRTVTGDAEFAAGGAPLRLRTPAGAVAYRGVLRSASTGRAGDVRDTVNVLSLEKYLRGVVPQEVPALWHPDAVRAQAVAARTYAAYERRHPAARHYQFCDTSACQVYGGYSVEHPAATEAIRATRRQVLEAGGRPAFTQFSASNGGWTDAGGLSYLPAKRDPYDGWSGNPYRSWTTSVQAARIEAAWPSVGDLVAVSVTRRDGNGAFGGRAERVRITGSRGATTVSGQTFRSVLGLRSTLFRVV